MSEKECCHEDTNRSTTTACRIISALIFILIIAAIIILLIWAILRPTKPRFILQDATLFAFNLTAPNLLTLNLQITVASRNPNDRIGIFYDKLDVYASYRNQQVTLPTLLPFTYQGHNDVAIWSPFIYGEAVPVAPYFSEALEQDIAAGVVLVNVKVDGRVKWKVGTWVSGKYRINVNCPAYISFGDRGGGREGADDVAPAIKYQAGGPAVKYQLVQGCHVDVSAS